MRKLILALGVGLGLLLSLFLFGPGIIAVGAYTVSVTVVSESGAPIARLRCQADFLEPDWIPDLEKREADYHWRNPRGPFAGQSLSVQVRFSSHHRGWWFGSSHSQARHLLVEVEYQGGKQLLKVVDLPDCRKVKSVRVIVP